MLLTESDESCLEIFLMLEMLKKYILMCEKMKHLYIAKKK